MQSKRKAHPFCCSTHSPCTQGCAAQWSVPEWHMGPWVPGGHRQWKRFTLSTQVPPLMQGLDRHSLICTSHLVPETNSQDAHTHTYIYDITYSLRFRSSFNVSSNDSNQTLWSAFMRNGNTKCITKETQQEHKTSVNIGKKVNIGITELHSRGRITENDTLSDGE